MASAGTSQLAGQCGAKPNVLAQFLAQQNRRKFKVVPLSSNDGYAKLQLPQAM